MADAPEAPVVRFGTATALAGESDIVATFNAAREDEYEEIRDRCRDFLAEIEHETADEHFTYGELEENDEDLTKLRGWFDKVLARDAFGWNLVQDTRTALQACAGA
ncbi:MAG: Chromate resistance protein ChrB, partial [Sciscionella sp.]